MKKTSLILFFAVPALVLFFGAAMTLSSEAKRAEMPEGLIKNKPESEMTKVLLIRYAPDVKMECNNDGVCGKKENPKSCPSDCEKATGDTSTNSCYDFLSKSKPKWNWVENYYYSDGMEYSNTAASKWNAAAQTAIFGSGILQTNSWGVYDNMNSVLLGNYSDPDVLGVTALWYQGKNIYEYDIMLDTDYFPSGSFDSDTVLLHEFGHAAGMGDLYDTACIGEVMYGYLGEGEVKTDLTSNDIAGINKLYSR